MDRKKTVKAINEIKVKVKGLVKEFEKEGKRLEKADAAINKQVQKLETAIDKLRGVKDSYQPEDLDETVSAANQKKQEAIQKKMDALQKTVDELNDRTTFEDGIAQHLGESGDAGDENVLGLLDLVLQDCEGLVDGKRGKVNTFFDEVEKSDL